MGRESIAVFSSHASTLARECLSAALQSPQTIAPMPRICAQLAELTADAATDGAAYARLMQGDPVLAGEIMRVANSPALRARRAIVSLQQAVAWLGIAEVRDIAMAIMLRGEVFVATGHESESEELWREAWFASLWAKEIARQRRKHVESAFLAALMHRTGAALALKVLSRFEMQQRLAIDARGFGELIAQFESPLARSLMQEWRIPGEICDAATGWREYQASPQADLAATVHAAHLLAEHALHPQMIGEEIVLENAVFEHLGIFLDDRKLLLAKLDQVRLVAGF